MPFEIDFSAGRNSARRELEPKIERLRAALKPFADAVYNDNGDMTITPCSIDDYAKAYFVMRDLEK